MKCKKTRIIAISGLLIIRCTTERKDIFHIHSSIINLDIEFVYKVYLNYKFNEFKNHLQSNVIEKILNKNCFESFIIKVVIFNDNA